MKRNKPAFKLVPIDRKFQPGDQVKPTAVAIQCGWNKPGTVEDCGVFAVQVKLAGETLAGWYAQDFWEKES